MDEEILSCNAWNTARCGCICSSHESFLKFEVLKPLAIQYKANINDLQVELRQMARMIERKRAENTLPAILMDSELPVLEFHNFVTRYKDAFLELYTLSKIACTIPVSSSEAARTFYLPQAYWNSPKNNNDRRAPVRSSYAIYSQGQSNEFESGHGSR